MTKVFINGTFDILHPGHIKLIVEAKVKYLASYLLIAIDSDRRVKELKGPNRPINTLENRKTILQHIKGVDAVWDFDSDEDLERIIALYKPDIMIKGADYRNHYIVGAHMVPKIEFVELTNDSTTRTIERITSR
jgi:rfaE bifunctional protein nucleotidyltransferase chain/domain